MIKITSSDINRLFNKLNEKLKNKNLTGELFIVGGAVMCLVFNSRQATVDIDGYFKPTKVVRNLAKQIAEEEGLTEKWLNDGVKGFLSKHGSFDKFLDLSHLKIFCASAEYLLAMKCLAMRIGEEFHDLSDIQYLLRYLNIDSYQDALDIITEYYPLDRFPQKTLYALEEMITKN